MKKLGVLLVTMLCVLGGLGCESKKAEAAVVVQKAPADPLQKAWKFYGTPHVIRRAFSSEQTVTVKHPGEGSFSGGFFLFLGGASGEYREGSSVTTKVTHVRFAWDTGDRGYMITTLPLEKIMIKPMPKGTHPAVLFSFTETSIQREINRLIHHETGNMISTDEDAMRLRIIPMLNNLDEPEEAFAKLLGHAIFYVPENLWPENINLPSGGFGDK